MAPWVKDPEWSLLWFRFHLSLSNFHMPWAQQKNKIKYLYQLQKSISKTKLHRKA